MGQTSDSLLQNWAALLAVSLGIFAITLDGSMMPVAIGSIVDSLDTEVGFVQAAMALHSLVMASMYLAAGKLGDWLGTKRIFLIGAIVFAIGTLIAALSPNIWVLLLGWSFIKPIGGAMMIPAANSLIVLNYKGQQRSTAFSIFSAFVAAAAVIGPVWMGVIAGTLGWRWAFGSEPLLIVLLVFFATMVSEGYRDEQMKFDYIGSLLAFIGLGMLVLGATLAGEFGWWQARRPFYVGETEITLFGLSAALLIIFAGTFILTIFVLWGKIQRRRGGVPLFHVHLLKNRFFTLGAALGLLFQLTVGGLLFVLPVFLQSALQLGALETGIVLLPYTLGIFILALITSRLPTKFSAPIIVQCGLVVMLIGCCWVYFTASLELIWASIIPALFCFGAGAGMVLSRLTGITLSTIVPAELGEASGGDSTGKELGVAFGVSVLGSLFLLMVYGGIVDRYDDYHRIPTTTEEARDQAIIELEDWANKITGEEWQRYLNSWPKATQEVYISIINDAYLDGYRKTLQILIGIIVLMFMFSLLLSKHKALQQPVSPNG